MAISSANKKRWSSDEWKTLTMIQNTILLFIRQLNIKGSGIECGVHNGGGVMAWAKISSILEPYNYHRKIIGFDTFKEFPETEFQDDKKVREKLISAAGEQSISIEQLTTRSGWCNP